MARQVLNDIVVVEKFDRRVRDGTNDVKLYHEPVTVWADRRDSTGDRSVGDGVLRTFRRSRFRIRDDGMEDLTEQGRLTDERGGVFNIDSIIRPRVGGFLDVYVSYGD